MCGELPSIEWTRPSFEQLCAERARGEVFTLPDWLSLHPLPDEAFTQTLAGVARRALDGEVFMHAVRELLDEVALMASAPQRQSAIAERPPTIGDARHDAYLAALAEHLAARHGLRRPVWTCEAERFLRRFWFVSDVKGFRALALVQLPAAFRRRGIFIAEASLQRC